MDGNWRSLFTGLDLRGWRTNSATASRWHVEGEHIFLRAGTPSPETTLWTDAEFGDMEFFVDCRVAKPAPGQELSVPRICFGKGLGEGLKLEGVKPETYQRFLISVKGREVTVKTEGQPTQHLTLGADVPARRPLGLGDNGLGAEFMNIYAGD
jgi:hypothetical protein